MPMVQRIILISLMWLTLPFGPVFGQSEGKLSGHEMEFWVGEWDLKWTVQGREGSGSNSVSKTLGGMVIHEHFSGEEGSYAGFKGESFTIFDPRMGSYFQTWVDNNGGYLDFTFARENEKYIFEREAEYNDKPVKSRMVFYDIEPNSFTWDWERMNPDSDSWELQWRIFYSRKERLEDVGLKRLEWLIGRWKNIKNGDMEIWKRSEDGQRLEGTALAFTDGRTDSSITERLRIAERDGKLFYTANPVTSSNPTEFEIISMADTNFVSYNPDHDFPQRIEYHRTSQGSMKAVIKDYHRSMSFSFSRE